jgi:hypothetical protein
MLVVLFIPVSITALWVTSSGSYRAPMAPHASSGEGFHGGDAEGGGYGARPMPAPYTPGDQGPGDPTPPSVMRLPAPVRPTNPRLDLLDKQRQLLRSGRIVHNVPAQMRVNAVTTVSVTVAGELLSPYFPLNRAGYTVQPALVGSDLVANLDGADFEIKRIGGEDGRRTLATDSSATWEWQVRPLTSGPRILLLTLLVNVAGEGPPTDVRTLSQHVDVQADPIYASAQLLKAWLPVTGITVPVVFAGAFYVCSRNRGLLPDSEADVSSRKNGRFRRIRRVGGGAMVMRRSSRRLRLIR